MMSPDAKPMKGHLREITEIMVDEGGDTYRAAYTARLRGVVYVLHVFKKKSKSGRATPKADLDLIEQRYKAAKRHYKMYVRLERESG